MGVIKNQFDTWSIRDYGPKGGKITKYFLKHTTFQNFKGPTPNKIYWEFIYEFKTYDALHKKLNELYEEFGGYSEYKKWLKKKDPSIIINDYAMKNAWYLMPPHYGKTGDLFDNKKYTDETCYTSPYYTTKSWVIECNKFSKKMAKSA